MADQSSIPLFDSQRMPSLNAMGNELFFGLNEAGGPELPCTCNGTGSCGRCSYMTSPTSPTSHNNHMLSSLDNLTLTYAGPPAPFFDDEFLAMPTIPTIQLAERPARPVINTEGMGGSFQYPPNTEQHLANIYTPGYRPSNMFVQPHETLLTPVTPAPSVNEEPFNMSPPFDIRDLVGKGRERIQLEYQPGYYNEANILKGLINSEGYRIHGTGNEAGQEGGIRALQKALSFNLKGRVPATAEQLKSLLRSVRAPNNFSHNPVDLSSELAEVLTQYGVQSNAYFRLGLVTKGSHNDSYKISVYGFGPKPIIWLFYDVTGDDTGAPDQWFAIIPNDSNNKGSYAAALANPAPLVPPQSAAGNPRDPSRLHPGYSRPSTRGSRSGQHNKRPPSSPRNVPGRNNKAAKGNGGRGRRPGSGSRTPSEAGSPEVAKHHTCLQCKKSFLYPKDLRRHLTTHSHRKGWKCPLCPKEFTRKDNMNRHLTNDHAGHTPPASTVVSH